MIHLDLTPDLEAHLASEAHARGLSTERYAEDLLASAFQQDEGNTHGNLLDEADTRKGIRRGLADADAGRTRSAREVFAELDRRVAHI